MLWLIFIALILMSKMPVFGCNCIVKMRFVFLFFPVPLSVAPLPVFPEVI